MPTINNEEVKFVHKVLNGKVVMFVLECMCTNPTKKFKAGQWYRDGLLIEVPDIGVDFTGYKACCRVCGYAPWIISPRP